MLFLFFIYFVLTMTHFLFFGKIICWSNFFQICEAHALCGFLMGREHAATGPIFRKEQNRTHVSVTRNKAQLNVHWGSIWTEFITKN